MLLFLRVSEILETQAFFTCFFAANKHSIVENGIWLEEISFLPA